MKLSLPRFREVAEVLRRFGAGRLRPGGAPGMRPPRREVLILAAVGVVAAAVTLIVLSVSFPAGQPRTGQPEPAASLTVDDFLLPAPQVPNVVPDYYPFRPGLSRWSRENVEKFWVSPRRIAEDAIEKINDRNMESMFEKIK